jgi:iron complex transport system ATP-binding protein
MSGPALALRDLSVSFGGRQVLSEVSFTAEGGSFVAVVGPNGAGKTTLLRAIAALVPASGTVTLDGQPLASLPLRTRAQRIAYLPQGHVFHWPMAVSEIVALGRLPRGAGADLSAADREAVTKAMALTGTTEYADRPVTTLSGGERARVAIARVLATEAPIILADEPTASLDPHYQLAVINMLRRHAQSFGLVVAVLHDLGLAARYADRIVIIDDGRIVADGAPRAVLTAARLAQTFRVGAEIVEVRGAPVVVPWSLSPPR